MRTRIAVIVAGAALALTAALTGCSGRTSSGGDSSSSQQLPPIIVNIDKAAGTTVTVPLSNVVDVNVGSTDVTKWTAKIGDADIVSFTKGKDDGSAQFNPGFEPIAPGTTDVTMSNGDQDVKFTVTVTK